jgi:ABC-type microcin C transport system duplicated ATPase subunit YejF
LVPRPGSVTAGEVVFEGRELSRLGERELRSIRGSQLAMVFQDPMTSLNPFLPVWVQIAEVVQLHLDDRSGEI